MTNRPLLLALKELSGYGIACEKLQVEISLAELYFTSEDGHLWNQQYITLKFLVTEILMDNPLRFFLYRNIQLTQAGKIYVENSRELLRIKKNTYAILKDLKNDNYGEITIGVTLGHGIDLFTAVFPGFNKRYPNIAFNLVERPVADQQGLLTRGKLDFGIVVLGELDKDNLEYIPIFQVDLILGISKQHPLSNIGIQNGDVLPSIDLNVFQNETFALMSPNSTMRHIIDPAFATAGFEPKILIESGLVHALAQMVSANLCCTILPHSKGIESRYWDNIAWFRLSPPLRWCTYITHRKNTYLTNAAKYFIQLAQEYGELTKVKLMGV
ncbi:MAG: LysR family transcriptional regulator substrate-binding protein [Lachnospiraceae bacterium]